ncbi:helix-turn-helix transcriptional regulator [Actinocrinis sp.]|uniref:helix-turn-helix domain-containing protein n=1 Tax=Actinocrinis sp. TaxID=1920516 RepID=UPI002DDD5121|nr:helix-turn-helix transcriptional regulator [Actinocrinis sp.]
MTSTHSGLAPTDPRRLTPSDAVGARIREERQRRGWTATQLAEKCTRAGARNVSKTVLAHIEGGRPGTDGQRRRDVTVDELLMFAAALDVAPLHLMGFPQEHGEQIEVMVNATTPVGDPDELLLWMRGDQPLPETDSRIYFTTALQHMPMPDPDRVMDELRKAVLQDRAKELAAQFRASAQSVAAQAREQVESVIGQVGAALATGADVQDVLVLLRNASERFREDENQSEG